MLRVYVDSGSSIKMSEKEKYGVEIIPLKILLGEKEYSDGVDLTMEEFYHQLIDNKKKMKLIHYHHRDTKCYFQYRLKLLKDFLLL